ncbi:hypothetical protein [Fodinicola acaciae]|uniref:hypothetical protein n=1 Tax=Fodinicola acaciae TaxID=2681555 RepID=UPI0013D33BA6|nr:hypothetical protein [Fodinicola acaciae]
MSLRIRERSFLAVSQTRRRFMKVGATGLAAAALVMAKASPAMATYPCGCCNLAYTARSSVEWCLVNGDWLWYCGSCTCCEADWATASASNCC